MLIKLHESPWPDEPESITEGYQVFEDSEWGRYYSAHQLSKSDATPWPDTEGAASRLTRDGEFAVNVVLLQDTSAGLALLNGDAISALTEDQRDESLNLNTVGVPDGWEKWLEQDKDGNYRLILQETSDGVWVCERQGKQFAYSRELGLSMTEVKSAS